MRQKAGQKRGIGEASVKKREAGDREAIGHEVRLHWQLRRRAASTWHAIAIALEHVHNFVLQSPTCCGSVCRNVRLELKAHLL
eukprot:6214297-Pleurochrysis_carterae.AAC.1